MSEPRLRLAARALVLDPSDRTLLVRMGEGEAAVWVTPGGGIEPGETDEDAVRRELREETGLVEFVLGPLVWVRTAYVPLGGGRWDGEIEHVYLVRADGLEPAPLLPWATLRAEGVHEVRWWTAGELEAANERFAPRRLPLLLRELILHGPPAEPFDTGL